jgi:hypothetical protein
MNPEFQHMCNNFNYLINQFNAKNRLLFWSFRRLSLEMTSTGAIKIIIMTIRLMELINFMNLAEIVLYFLSTVLIACVIILTTL